MIATPQWHCEPDFALARSVRDFFGTDQPVAKRYRFDLDALSIDIVDGNIGPVCWYGRTIIRGIQFVTRDPHWVRLPWHCQEPVLTTRDTEHVITLTGSVECGAARFDAVLELAVRSPTAFDMRLDGNWSQAVQLNRQGLVVLHPAAAAGLPAGRLGAALATDPPTLPVELAPHQPFRDLVDFRHELPGGGCVTFRFRGETFEMEDQRNWSDASFKTYCPPLGPPLPYRLEPGPVQTQRIEIQIEAPATPRVYRKSDIIDLELTRSGTLIPPIGQTLDDGVTPAYPAVALTVRPDGVAGSLAALAGDNRDVMLNIHLDAADPFGQLSRLAARCGKLAVAPDRIALFAAHNRPLEPDAIRAARDAFPQARIGGGTIAHFIDLHRDPARLDSLDFATHALCPVVHDPAHRAVLETVSQLPLLLRTGRQVAGARDYVIGHVGLSLPFRPNGSPTIAAPNDHHVTSNRSDPRDRSALGRAWCVGFLSAAAAAGVSRVYLSSALSRIMAGFSGAGGAAAMSCSTSGPSAIAAIGWDDGSRWHLAVANLSHKTTTVALKPDDDIGLWHQQALQIQPLETVLIDSGDSGG